jgi:putative FmdB family regulatory protein
MPIYEYRCSTCGFQKEYLQKLSDPLFTLCPACSKQTFGKMLTAAGFQLKGSGWYATDFKNSGAKPAVKAAEGAKADVGADGKSEAGTDTTGDKKSETRTEVPAAATAAAAATPAPAAAPSPAAK